MKDPHLVATWSLAMACDAINLAGLLIGRPSPGPPAHRSVRGICNGKFYAHRESFSIVEQTRKAHNTALWERNLRPCWPPERGLKTETISKRRRKKFVATCRSMHKRAAKWLNDGATRTARGVARL